MKPISRPPNSASGVKRPARPGIPPLPVYMKSTLSPILRKVMEISGTHQAEVARRMGIRPQSLNQYIQNRRCRPSLEWLLHFLQVNGAYLAIVFPTTGQYQDVVAKAAELEMTPLRWEMEFASQPDLPLEANPETNLESKLETNLEPNLEPEAEVEDDGE